MAVTGFMEMGGKSFDSEGAVRRYTVNAEGESDPEDAVREWLEANTPITIAGHVRRSFQATEYPELEDVFECEVNYGAGGTPATAPAIPTGSMEYRFQFQAEGGLFFQSLETIASYAPDEETAPDLQGALGVERLDGQFVPAGIQVDPPPETFVLHYCPENAVVDESYQLLVESLCGCVNAFPYRGRPAGSLMLVRVNGGIRTGEDWSIEFGFGYVPNRESIPVGDNIVVDAKDGLDLLQVIYSDKEDLVADVLLQQPIAAYVERVWPRADFELLNLPL